MPPSLSIYNTSKWHILEVMTRWKMSFRAPPIFSLSRIPSIGILDVLAKELSSFLCTTINSTVFFFMVPFNGIFARGFPLMMDVVCWSFPLFTPLFLSLVSSLLASGSIVLEGNLFFGDSSTSLLPPLVYSDK